ncbi:hypothetical protein Ahy_A03g013137 [Arachis hypogaea]|uniref:Replication protein A 70 kDa DNA-binding subunit B/D first OB fold domain-containing protein n=1 Tax=Arachis hypogaea TaxID=3818 RepID=A0A445DUR6_ARAHY|nr:hypothetical protein Ahy_A03g013137 [Arachis hypogaea]
MHPPIEAWKLKVRILRLWVVLSFGNHECEKIQATIKKQLLNRFKYYIVEGQVYRMANFTVVSNHGSYRATSHKFKLVFLHRTTVVPVGEDVILKTCFNMFPFSELLNMTQDYDFLVGMYNHCAILLFKLCLFGKNVIGLLTSVGRSERICKRGENWENNCARINFKRQNVNGIQLLFIANEGKVVSLEDDYMKLTRRCTIEEL